MINEVEKIIEHQITSGKTEVQVCNEIGVDRRTIYNIRVGKHCSASTQKKINNFIKKEGL
jgi:hypothetical protein